MPERGAGLERRHPELFWNGWHTLKPGTIAFFIAYYGRMRDTPGDHSRDREDAEPQESPESVLAQAAALYRAGRSRDALDRLAPLVAASNAPPNALAIAARIATELGDLERALHYYHAAVLAAPGLAELQYGLGLTLARLGRSAEAVVAYREAARLRPDLLPAHNNLGVILQAMGRWPEAVEAYRNALQLAPSAELHRNLGIALEGAGRHGEAAASYRRAIALNPQWAAPYQNLATTLLEQGDAQGAIEACDAWLRLRPGLPEPIGLKAVALYELGQRDAARHLVDLDRFLRIIEIKDPPAGYDSLSAFHAALVRDGMAHPTLHSPGAADPHYNGPGFRTTWELFGQESGAYAALEAIFSRALADYLATVAVPDPAHPFLAQPMPRLRPSAVITVLERPGRLAPHMHYAGYVSGVYYCQIPEAIGAPGRGREGWFEIGCLPPRFHHRGDPEIRSIQPREGMMLLFPSYIFHRTLPFDSAQTRISIAFDTIPEP